MKSALRIEDPEVLLSHAGFVRNLARRLLHDEHAADDVVQDTWLTALQNPPPPKWPLQAWLGGVVRNIIRSRRRRDIRQTARERQFAESEVVCSTEEVVEQEATRRRVVEKVLKLKEPYRTAVLLRFYHDAPPRRIARLQNIPVDTVKTRIRRGIDLLRRRLDADSGGERRAWTLSLMPLAGLKSITSSSAATASAATFLQGAIVMSAYTKTGIVTTMILGVLISIWCILPNESDMTRETGYQKVEDPLKIVETGGRAIQSSVNDESIEDSRDEDGRISLSPRGPIIAGQVSDALTGEPVRSFDFYLYPRDRDIEFSHHETIRHSDGRFQIPLPQGGTYTLSLSSSRHINKTLFRLKVHEESGLRDLSITMDPGISVEGQVLDAITGLPVSGVTVGPAISLEDTLVQIEKGFNETGPNANTDSSGRFILSGLEDRFIYKVTAIHPDYCQGWARYHPDNPAPITIHLKRGFTIFGTAYSDEGEPLSGVRIAYMDSGSAMDQKITSGPGGIFRTGPVAPGPVHMTAEPPWSKTKDTNGFSKESCIVTISSEDVEISFGPNNSYVTWCGRVCNAEGENLAGAFLRVDPDRSWKWPNLDGLNSFKRSATCDEEGRFKINKLPPGRYQISLYLNSDSNQIRFDKWRTETFGQAGPVERDLVLGGRAIQGIVVDEASGQPVTGKRVSVKMERDGSIFSAKCDETGKFCIEGLMRGRYLVRAVLSRKCEGQPEIVVIDKERIIDGLRLTIPQTGRLVLRLKGFNEPNARFFKYTISKPGGEILASITTGVINNEVFKELEAGAWVLRLAYLTARGTGFIEHAFEITPGCDTEILIPLERLTFSPNSVSVSGSLVLSDGSPVAGADIVFEPDRMMMVSTGESKFPRLSEFVTTTGPEGRFDAAGLSPGVWGVLVDLPEMGVRRFPTITLYGDEGIATLNLVLPTGEIVGSMLRQDTGEALSEKDLEWTALLHIADKSQAVFQQSGRGSDTFRLKCVPEGQYELTLSVPGFKAYRSDSFALTGGESVNLGIVPLAPCGLIKLEVVDSKGMPVDWLGIECNGRWIGSSHRTSALDFRYNIKVMSDGTYLVTDLPTGLIELGIEASNCLPKSINLELHPARAVEVRIELEPEP